MEFILVKTYGLSLIIIYTLYFIELTLLFTSYTV